MELEPRLRLEAGASDSTKSHQINHRPGPFLIDEELNPLGFDEMYDRATRKIDFVVIDADTGEDIARILPPSCLRMARPRALAADGLLERSGFVGMILRTASCNCRISLIPESRNR